MVCCFLAARCSIFFSSCSLTLSVRCWAGCVLRVYQSLFAVNGCVLQRETMLMGLNQNRKVVGCRIQNKEPHAAKTLHEAERSPEFFWTPFNDINIFIYHVYKCSFKWFVKNQEVWQELLYNFCQILTELWFLDWLSVSCAGVAWCLRCFSFFQHWNVYLW